MKISRAVVAIFFAVSLAASLFGQAVFGNIGGTVKDPTGAFQAGASITIPDLDRGNSYHVQASADGNTPRIVLGVAIMSTFVLLFNRLLWRPMYAYAARRLTFA